MHKQKANPPGRQPNKKKFKSQCEPLAEEPAQPNRQAAEEHFFGAIEKGDINEVKRLLGQGTDANMRGMLGWRPLMEAVQFGHLEICKLLIEHGADVNRLNAWNETALIAAARFGHGELYQFLLALGANPLLKDEEGKTAYDCAVDYDAIKFIGHKPKEYDPITKQERYNLIRKLKEYEEMWREKGLGRIYLFIRKRKIRFRTPEAFQDFLESDIKQQMVELVEAVNLCIPGKAREIIVDL